MNGTNAGQRVGASGGEIWRPRFSPWLVGMVVSTATFMEVLDTSVANVALPHIAGNLASTTDESTWVLTSYLVSNAIILPMSGWFSALLGRKRFYMACVVLFTISSLLCGLAPSLGLLILFRVLQGLGGGGLQPSVQAILVDIYPPAKRGMGMALYGVAVVTAPIIGPTLGGWITDNFSWRWIFLINIPVGVMSLLLTYFMLEDPPHLLRKRLGAGFRIDYMGMGLLALGLGSLQIMLDKGEREDWFSSDLIITLAVIAALSLLAAVFWELRHDHPIADLRLLKDRNFALATITLFCLGFVLYSSTMLLPLLLQTLLGYTAMLAGMALSPGGLMTMLLMPLVGWLLGRVEARWLMVCGLTVGALALFHMAGFSLAIDFQTAVWSRIYLAAGLAFLFVPLNTSAYHFIPKERVNNASGLFNLARNIGGSVGIAVMITQLSRRAQFHQSALIAHLTPYDEPFRQAIQSATNFLAGHSADPVAGVAAANQMLYGQVQRQAAMMAYVDLFQLAGMIFVAVIPLVLLMRKALPEKGRPAVLE